MIKRLLLPLAALVALSAAPVRADPPVYAEAVASCTAPNHTSVPAGIPVPIAVDPNQKLCVNATVSASIVGTQSNASSGVATSSTNLQSVSWLYLFNGTTWDQAQDDGSKNLKVNCAVGCSAGALSNASDAVATSSTNAGSLGFNYGFNGTTWDRLRDDTNKYLYVDTVAASGAFAAGSGADGWDVTEGAKADSAYAGSGSASLVALGKGIYSALVAPLPAGTNVIGHVVVDTAPSTAVTNAGTFAVQAAPAPGTTGGLASYVLEPAASDNHANIKNGAGQVYHITAFNNSATINYLRLYNAGTGFNGCNSATNLVWEGHIPANTSDAGFVEDISQGLAFSTGISICVTGAYGQTSTTNATASAISINVLFK